MSQESPQPAQPNDDAKPADAPPEESQSPWPAIGRIYRRLGPAGPLAVLAATLPAIGGFALLGLAWKFAPWLRDQQAVGLVLYIVGFAVLSGLAVLPTYAQAGVGGAVFGLAAGVPAAIAGYVGGAAIGYVIARRASGDRVMTLLQEQPKWRAVHNALLGGRAGRTFLIVTLLRVPPNSPFAITNLVLAATQVRLPIYLAVTLVGMAPRTAAAVYIGGQFGPEGGDSTWFTAAGIAVAVVVILIIGSIAQRALAKVTAGGGE